MTDSGIWNFIELVGESSQPWPIAKVTVVDWPATISLLSVPT
ncbi:MAG: hypothetical protein ABIR32_20400 [Ilumatobacteraceae bacterium]